jgi:regulator of ribonuclease activity A
MKHQHDGRSRGPQPGQGGRGQSGRQTAQPPATTDVCDASEDRLTAGSLRVLPPVFQNYGGAEVMSGPIATLKVFEDNAMVRQVLETLGQGRVLVVDGGGSDRCALVGGQLAQLAERNGWAGVLVHGCVRDVAEMIDCQVGIWAIATHPRRCLRTGQGHSDLVLDIAGVTVRPGEWCLADADGVLISDRPIS